MRKIRRMSSELSEFLEQKNAIIFAKSFFSICALHYLKLFTTILICQFFESAKVAGVELNAPIPITSTFL